jgi:hypothetical protein
VGGETKTIPWCVLGPESHFVGIHDVSYLLTHSGYILTFCNFMRKHTEARIDTAVMRPTVPLWVGKRRHLGLLFLSFLLLQAALHCTEASRRGGLGFSLFVQPCCNISVMCQERKYTYVSSPSPSCFRYALSRPACHRCHPTAAVRIWCSYQLCL